MPQWESQGSEPDIVGLTSVRGGGEVGHPLALSSREVCVDDGLGHCFFLSLKMNIEPDRRWQLRRERMRPDQRNREGTGYL
jgi:hypothetical protein